MKAEAVPPTLLLVDDDFIFALSLKVFLKEDFNILHAENCTQAAALLQSHPIDGAIFNISFQNSLKEFLSFTGSNLCSNDGFHTRPIVVLATNIDDINSFKNFYHISGHMLTPIDYELFRILLLKIFYGSISHDWEVNKRA